MLPSLKALPQQLLLLQGLKGQYSSIGRVLRKQKSSNIHPQKKHSNCCFWWALLLCPRSVLR